LLNSKYVGRSEFHHTQITGKKKRPAEDEETGGQDMLRTSLPSLLDPSRCAEIGSGKEKRPINSNKKKSENR